MFSGASLSLSQLVHFVSVPIIHPYERGPCQGGDSLLAVQVFPEHMGHEKGQVTLAIRWIFIEI